MTVTWTGPDFDVLEEALHVMGWWMHLNPVDKYLARHYGLGYPDPVLKAQLLERLANHAKWAETMRTGACSITMKVSTPEL